MLRGLATSLACLVGLLSYPALGQSADGAKKPKTHLMWHLSPSDGATPELASRIEKALRSHFEQKHGDLLMHGLTMDSLLLVEGNEKFLRCGTGAGCLSGLGELAGIKFVIAGEVSLVEGRTTTRLMLLETASKNTVSRADVDSGGLPGKALMDELAVAMFSPERYIGTIDLTAPVTGAEVLIDGRKVGLTPLVGPLADIPAGEHLVEVKKPGRQPFARKVYVPLGKVVRVVALLPEIPFQAGQVRPFYKDWPFWTAVGVGVAAMGTAAGLHSDASVLQDNADFYERENRTEAQAEQDKADARYLQTYVMYGIGGAGLLAAGLIAIIDSASSGDGQKSPPAGAQFSLTSGPGGLGLGACVRF